MNSNRSLIRKAFEDELSHLLQIEAIDCITIRVEQIVNRLMTHIVMPESGYRGGLGVRGM